MDYNYPKVDPTDTKYQQLKLPKTKKKSLKIIRKFKIFV